ncbi:MAG: hypothetical protein GY801_09780 [bacterium]|nr:hypothetical protein [bacterium]
MELPVDLKNKIVKYLTSLPNIEDKNVQRALISRATLDAQFVNSINFDAPTDPFFQLLVGNLIRFGELKDGRNALEAILNASKSSIGNDRKPYCDLLIQEWQFQRQKGQTFVPGFTHDVIVLYAFRENKPTTDSEDGLVTKFVKSLRKKLSRTFDGTDRYSLCTVCLDGQVDENSELESALVEKLRGAATLLVILSQNYVDAYLLHNMRNELVALFEKRSGLDSTVFVIETHSVQAEERPPELCGLPGFPYVEGYGYASMIHELSCELADRLHALKRRRQSTVHINQTLANTFPTSTYFPHLQK